MKYHLPDCYFTSIDMPAPSESSSSSCVVKAVWCEGSAFTFEAQLEGRTITLPPPSVPPKEAFSDLLWPFAMCTSGSVSISFSSKVASALSERMSMCERIFHRRLIRRKRYREHAPALAKRLAAWAKNDSEKASQLVSDHRKFREVTEVEFWALMNPSKRDRASWLKELFEFGVRTRVAWKACERQSDVQSAGVWATDEANANSQPADSQSEDDEPVAGPSSISLLPPSIPVSSSSFVVQLESLKGDRRNSILASNFCSQADDGELPTVKCQDPYVVLDDSSVDLNSSKSSRPTATGVLHAGHVDVTLLDICENVVAASASYALQAVVKTLHHVDLNDPRELFSSVGCAELVSFLFNFISSENMPIQFAFQIGALLDSMISVFGISEFERFLGAQVVKDASSCSRCLQFLKVVTSRWHNFSLLNSAYCTSRLTDALFFFSSPHIRVHILRLFSLSASRFQHSTAHFKHLFLVLNAGYTYLNYGSNLEIACPDLEPEVFLSVGDSDPDSFMISSHAAIKSLNAIPAVQSALFEFTVQVMLSPNGRDLVSPVLYNSIPPEFVHTAWSLTCCKPLAFCAFVPEVSLITEALDILSLSEFVTLPASGSEIVLPTFVGASGVKFSLPAVRGSFTIFWPGGRSLKFASSPRHSSQMADTKPSEGGKKLKMPCRNWVASASCKFGSKCRFLHAAPPSEDSPPVPPPPPPPPPPPIASEEASAGGGAAVSHDRRRSVAESVAAFESKLRARGGDAAVPASLSHKLAAPLLEILLEGQPCSIVFHHDAFSVSVAPIYIPCFCTVQDLASKDPTSDDVTACALGLCTRYAMFDQALKVLDVIASADRIPSLAEHSLAIASCSADSVDRAFHILNSMESHGQSASFDVIQVLADQCAAVGQYERTKQLNAKCKGSEATNAFRVDTSVFSKRLWPAILECISQKRFNLFFDAFPNSVSESLVQFASLVPSTSIRPFVEAAIAGCSQQGGRFEASLSRFRASKAKCKGASDDGNTVFAQLLDIVAQKGIRTFRSPAMEAPLEVRCRLQLRRS